MIKQILRRGQLTIPSVILKRFNLKEKDYLEVTASEDSIVLRPVTVTDYSHKEIEQFRKKLDRLPRGKKTIFSSFPESKKHLDSLKEK